MTVILKTMDQVPGASSVHGPDLSFQAPTVTARDIVRARVEAEVERYNSDDSQRPFVGLVAPAKVERELNGPMRQRRRPLDAERQIDVALAAIRKGGVILLFNGVQVEDIDAPLLITPVSEARFLKLVPLVGG
jgi:hypothetical protein